jgi:inorganic triphosphatase YgiF
VSEQSDFEMQVKCAAEKAVLKFIADGGWLLPNYESRLKIPAEWIAECWKMVDADKLKRQIASRLEAELTDRMVNRMAEELSTDVKQILSVKERREALRALARDHMDSIMKAGS